MGHLKAEGGGLVQTDRHIAIGQRLQADPPRHGRSSDDDGGHARGFDAIEASDVGINLLSEMKRSRLVMREQRKLIREALERAARHP